MFDGERWRGSAPRPSVEKLQGDAQNKAYVGIREVNKKNKNVDPEPLPQSQRYREVKANWEPILNRETFDRAQRLQTANTLSCRNVAKQVRHVDLFNGGLL